MKKKTRSASLKTVTLNENNSLNSLKERPGGALHIPVKPVFEQLSPDS